MTKPAQRPSLSQRRIAADDRRAQLRREILEQIVRLLAGILGCLLSVGETERRRPCRTGGRLRPRTPESKRGQQACPA